MRWGGHMRCSCVYCLCLAGRVSFSTRAPEQSLTTANQRRTWTRILSSSFMWRTPATESRYSFTEWLSKPGERAHDRNSISAVGGIRTHNLLIDSPACYHWAITALQMTLYSLHIVYANYTVVYSFSFIRNALKYFQCMDWFNNTDISIQLQLLLFHIVLLHAKSIFLKIYKADFAIICRPSLLLCMYLFPMCGVFKVPYAPDG